jgi:hypothetical protein
MEIDPVAETVATFMSDQPILDGRPAAIQRKIGKGVVVKLGFWPGDPSLPRLIKPFVPDSGSFLAAPAPQGVVAVPHSDNSLFVVNTTGQEMLVRLVRTVTDRLSEANLTPEAKLQPYQVWWLV